MNYYHNISNKNKTDDLETDDVNQIYLMLFFMFLFIFIMYVFFSVFLLAGYVPPKDSGLDSIFISILGGIVPLMLVLIFGFLAFGGN